MKLGFNPGSQTISIVLTLSEVKLQKPVLWRLVGDTYQQLPTPVYDLSAIRWDGIPRVGPDNSVILQLEWSAQEPMHDHWHYQSTIVALDQDDALLPGREGQHNPRVIPCDVGGIVPSWDHRYEAIVAL